ncbi:acyl carrier protein [Carnobacterium mobile]|uniref:acyl carrier protein n=1 Tax=Carnobacterium mobile TaxID=2750 RepID=UPI00054F0F64|nr:acyl carrier protein [Carnobacterium mobile]
MITLETIKEKLENLINTEVLKVTKINKNIPFTDQGIDSLDIMMIYVHIEETFNISLEDIYTQEVVDFKGLSGYIYRKITHDD